MLAEAGGGGLTTGGGGFGGGLTGGKGTGTVVNIGYPGTQTEPGVYKGSTAGKAGFGYGGDGPAGTTGGGRRPVVGMEDLLELVQMEAEAGGSGWVFTEENYGLGYTNSSYTGGTWLLGSKYFLKDAQTIVGSQSMPTTDGESTMTGKIGNGYAKISRIDVKGVDEILPRETTERPFVE